VHRELVSFHILGRGILIFRHFGDLICATYRLQESLVVKESLESRAMSSLVRIFDIARDESSSIPSYFKFP
jgi:hypothetical protein